MATTTSETDTTIEALLQQRAQYEQWLARLESASDKAPPAVRQRVRADYEGRLKGVIDELRGHAAAISEELERHRGAQAELDKERRAAEEALSEAEVRHTVGEFTEDEWRRINDESQSNLGRLRQELGSVGGEISRLAEVQSLISPPPRRPEPAPPPPPPPAPAPRAEVVEPPPPPLETLEPELEIEHSTPAPSAAAPQPTPSARPTPTARREPAQAPPPGDELAFLKSVSDEERKPATSPAEQSGWRVSGPWRLSRRRGQHAARPGRRGTRHRPGQRRSSARSAGRSIARPNGIASGVVGSWLVFDRWTATKHEGPAWIGGPFAFTACKARLLLLGSERNDLGEPALLPGRGVGVNQALAPRAVDHLYRLRVCGLGVARYRGTDLLDGRAQLASMRAVEGRMRLGLTHALLGGFDSRHEHLDLSG